MPTLLRATTDLVVTAWLASLPGLSSSTVGTVLPRPDANGNLSWGASGFVAVTTVGGTPGMYVPLASPVVQLDCWATNPGSAKPPYGKANALAELIRWAVYVRANFQRPLALLRPGYASARMLSAYLVTEPRRLYGDAADYARYQCDLAANWVEVTSP